MSVRPHREFFASSFPLQAEWDVGYVHLTSRRPVTDFVFVRRTEEGFQVVCRRVFPAPHEERIIHVFSAPWEQVKPEEEDLAETRAKAFALGYHRGRADARSGRIHRVHVVPKGRQVQVYIGQKVVATLPEDTPWAWPAAQAYKDGYLQGVADEAVL